MSDKYINFDVDDPRASAIAEVMANKTCKKILSLLTEKDMSVSEIANNLNMPLNTIDYNVKKLVEAGLIEPIKSVFWSVKGKRIPVYKISNKKILISPRKIGVMPLAMFAAILGALVLLVLLVQVEPKVSSVNNDLKHFTSYQELKDFIANNSGSNGYGFGLAKDVAVGGTQAAASNAISGESARDYSQTNIQVEGVDEPDIVKNDGKYIYFVSGNNVIIVDAYPAAQMKNISSISVNGSIYNIFVNGDKLIVFSNSYEQGNYAAKSIGVQSIMPVYNSRERVKVGVYDISDREKPVLEKEVTADGNYLDARMIGNYVYLVSLEYINNEVILPYYSVNGIEKQVQAAEIYYPDYRGGNYEFASVFAIAIDSDNVNNKVYLTSGGGQIYVSQNNIYLTYTKYLPQVDYQKRMIQEVMLPLLSGEDYSKVQEILSSSNFGYEESSKIMDIVYAYSSSLGKDKDAFDAKLQKSMQDFDLKISKENEKTIIHKIGIDKLEISYKGNGEVIGHALNQFSMDEFNGNFRIATTTGDTWNGNSLNHLFVLDKDLKQTGSVEDLAPGEKIYSVRFMGNRAYVVTFKKVDPFYVIDLTDKPKVLGYLKIPGYSDYLHPYDENHIIGIGKNALGGGENFAWYQGIKVSLFDVSDFENPIEQAHFDIGDRGTNSEALQDHKAFLFDKEKNILVLPIQLAEVDKTKYGQDVPNNAYGEIVWSGAYVLNINENNISLRGKITHIDNSTLLKPASEEPIGAKRIDWSGNTWEKTSTSSSGEGLWETKALYYNQQVYKDFAIDSFPNGAKDRQFLYNYQHQIKRSLFMDDTLYTISPGTIKSNNLNTIEEIKKLDFSSSSYSYYDRLGMAGV